MPEVLAHHEIQEELASHYRSPKKIILWAVTLFLIIFAFLQLTGIYRVLDTIIRWQIIFSLENSGFGNVKIDRLTYKRGLLTIEGLHIPHILPAESLEVPHKDDLYIGQMRTTCTWNDLRTVHFGNIELEGVTLASSLDANGQFSLGQINELFSERVQAKHPSFQHLKVLNSELFVMTPLGENSIRFAAEFQSTSPSFETIEGNFSTTGTLESRGEVKIQKGLKGTQTQVRLNQAKLETADVGVSTQEGDISLKSTPPGVSEAESQFQLDLNIQGFSSNSFGTLKRPLHLLLSYQGPQQGTKVNFSLEDPEDHTKIAHVSGELRLASIHGHLKVDVKAHPLDKYFDISPWIQKIHPDIQKLEGNISLLGEINWEGEWTSLAGPLTLKFEGMTAKIFNIDVQGLTGEVTIDRLNPLATKSAQIITTEHMRVGKFDFQNNEMRFLFNAVGEFIPQSFKGETLGGVFEAFNFLPAADTFKNGIVFNVAFKDIDMNELIALAEVDKLKANAKLQGRAFLSLKNGVLGLEEAHISSLSREGVVQFNAGEEAAPPQDLQGAALAFEVFKDLHFTVFEVLLSKNLNDPQELSAKINIMGFNPQILNAHPFSFNITTSGNLSDLVQNTLRNLSEPKDIRDIQGLLNAPELKRQDLKGVKEYTSEDEAPKEKASQ